MNYAITRLGSAMRVFVREIEVIDAIGGGGFQIDTKQLAFARRLAHQAFMQIGHVARLKRRG